MKIFQKINDFILDTLFPVSCLSCGQENFWLCEKCFKKISPLLSQTCPYCERESVDSGKICDACKQSFFTKNKTWPLDNLLVSTKYKENSLSRLVYSLKYNFVEELRVPLGKLMVGTILRNSLPLPDLIIPVPLHPRRLRWRGFNQSELLANYISRNMTPGLDIPVASNLIIRKKRTSPQMKIANYQERKENVSGAFSLKNNTGIPNERENVLKGKTILLVDDICTTGATMNECAKILKLNGAKKIYGVVIARQEIKNPR